MKKITLFLVFTVIFLANLQLKAQIIDDANWPNATWSITGSYAASGFVSNPTTTTNFSWDDDLAGSGSQSDDISAESPTIDLTQTFNDGNLQVIIELDYIYRRNSETVTLEWWNNDNGTWVVWQQFAPNSNNLDYKSCNSLQAFTSQPLTIASFSATQLLSFKYKIRYNDNGFDWGVCFGSPILSYIATPSCLEVSAITIPAATITASQAEVSWTDNNTVPPANGWEIEYGLTGYVQGSADLIAVLPAAASPFTITGLTGNTDYDVYVRALCSTTDQSTWIGPITFTTASDGGGGGNPNECGGQYVDSGGLANNYSSGEDITTVICPDIAGDVVTLNFLSFETESNFDDLSIYDGPDDTATLLGTFDGTNTPPNFTSSSADGCLTLVFHSDGSVTRSGYAANIFCGPPPTCFAVSNVNITAETIDGATVTWTDNNTPAPANGWDIVVVPTGSDPATGTPDVGVTNPYVISGLDASSSYDVYITAICDDGTGGPDPSFPTAATFSTLVAPPACGGVYIDSGGSTGNYQNNELETFVICPDNVGDVVTLQFLEFETENNWDDLTIYNGNTATGTPIGVFTGDTVPPIITSTDTSGCLTVVFDSDGSVTDPGWVANVLCSPPPTCFVIDTLAIDNVLNNSITLSWNDPMNTAPPTVYNIEYGAPGFAQGTGTEIGITAGVNNPYEITGLDAQTTYDFYVQAECTPGDTSFWAGPIQATTLCDVFTAPYTEDFEDAGLIDICWTQGNGNLENWLFGNNPNFTHIGNGGDFAGTTTTSNGFYSWVDDSGNHNNGTTLESPLIDISSLTVPSLSFYYISHDEGDSHVDFHVDVWDGAAWNPNMFFTNTTNTAGWEEIFVNLDVLTITGPVKVRFIVDENNGTDFSDDIAIDDVVIDEAPTCFKVTNLTVTGQTTTTGSISWVDNNTVSPVGGWTIEYGITGFVQGTGTLLNVPDQAPPLTAMLTPLVPSTNYDVYIRANCAADDSDSSLWTGPINIRTDDAPPPNDTCATATPMLVDIGCVSTLGNNILATSSTDLEGEIQPDCADPAANGVGGNDALDVWFTFVVPASGNVTIETSNAGGMVDTVLAAYSGACGALVELDCQDDSVISPNSDDFRFSSVTLRDLTPGDTIFLRVWSYDHFNDGNEQGAFNICVYGQSRSWQGQGALGTDNNTIDDIQLSYYPNPVNNILNVNSDKEISEIAVYSILGKEILRKSYNDTNVTINMEQLSTGTYFVKVLIDNNLKTIKVIKK